MLGTCISLSCAPATLEMSKASTIEIGIRSVLGGFILLLHIKGIPDYLGNGSGCLIYKENSSFADLIIFLLTPVMSTMDSEQPFTAVVTNGRNGPLVTVMAEGIGPIAAPGTFRQYGREAGIRCGLPERLLSGLNAHSSNAMNGLYTR